MVEQEEADPREALADEGLLSPQVETWRHIYIDNYRDWFELARELNRYAVSLFQDHQDAGDGGPANAAAPTAVRVYGRALNAYTASIMLAERAMTIEAVGAVRPIHEAGFWLSLLATNPEKALEELDIDHHKHAVDREQLRAAYPGNAELHSASVQREAAHAALLGKRRPISMKALAASLPGDPGYLQYRLASGFYEARRDARGLKLTDFRILRFEDTTPSSSHAETMLPFETSTGRREMQLSIGVMLDLGKDGIHLRGPMARWQVMGHALQEARRRLGEAGDQESVMP